MAIISYFLYFDIFPSNNYTFYKIDDTCENNFEFWINHFLPYSFNFDIRPFDV